MIKPLAILFIHPPAATKFQNFLTLAAMSYISDLYFAHKDTVSTSKEMSKKLMNHYPTRE
jgi:hypothetical protein